MGFVYAARKSLKIDYADAVESFLRALASMARKETISHLVRTYASKCHDLHNRFNAHIAMNMFNISFSYAIKLRMITRRRSYDESNEKQVVHSYRYILPTSCLSRLFFPMPILLVHSTPVTCTCTDVFTERPPRASDHCVDGLNAGVVVKCCNNAMQCRHKRRRVFVFLVST